MTRICYLMRTANRVIQTHMPSYIKPHFAPITLRSHFSPERILPPSSPSSSLSSRVAFGLENHHLPKPSPAEVQVQRQDNSYGSRYIPKPKGEFNRPSNGYALESMCKDKLEWTGELWSEVEVSLGQISAKSSSNIPRCSTL